MNSIEYDVIIITWEPFPYGLAATNRILSYGQKIAEKNRVLLISLCNEKYCNEYNIKPKGQFANIDYELLWGTFFFKNKNKFLRKIIKLFIYLKIYYNLLFKYKVKIIITYYYLQLMMTFMLKIICLLKRIKLLRDVTETPDRISSILLRNIEIQSYRLFDGIIVMTEGIRDTFSFIKNKKIFLLPLLIDIKRFKTDNIIVQNYFFYCSGGTLERDGLLDIIDGFLLFYKKNNNYILKIATSIDLNKEYDKKVYKLICENPVSIQYLGKISSEKIPELLISSTALLVTPHKDYVTKGFPTKLGEYFASGRPVICTSISTLNKIIPCDCAYIVKPNHPEEIANALVQIINDTIKSTILGKNVRKFMKSKFSIETYYTDFSLFLFKNV